MRVRPTESGKGQSFRRSKRAVPGCCDSQRHPQPGPVYMRPELISGGNAPKSIFDDLRVPWLSGRFADVATDLAQ